MIFQSPIQVITDIYENYYRYIFKFSFFPTMMSDGAVVWLRSYKQLQKRCESLVYGGYVFHDLAEDKKIDGVLYQARYIDKSLRNWDYF